MKTADLKYNIHKIVDEIKSEQLLQTLYDFLKVRDTDKYGQLWNALSAEQKEELLLSYEEAEDDNNLVGRNELFV